MLNRRAGVTLRSDSSTALIEEKQTLWYRRHSDCQASGGFLLFSRAKHQVTQNKVVHRKRSSALMSPDVNGT